MERYTAYQLSKELDTNFRTTTKLLKDFEEKGLIEIDGTVIDSKATIYTIPDDVKNEIATRLKQCNNTNAIVRNKHNEDLLAQIKELQIQQVQQQDTIRSLNNSLSNKDKEIWQLKNDKTVAESDLKVARAEMKLIEDKKNSLESAWSEARLKAEVLEQTVSQKDIELAKKNKQVWIMGASLFVALTVTLFVVALHIIK